MKMGYVSIVDGAVLGITIIMTKRLRNGTTRNAIAQNNAGVSDRTRLNWVVLDDTALRASSCRPER